MARKKRMLTATMADGWVKTIGPTKAPFTHFGRIVAEREGGGTEVFWGHATSLAEARRKHAAIDEAARQRGWTGFVFEVVALIED